MAEPAGFLARWSRLKRRARQSQPSNAASADVEAPAPAPEIIPEALPPIETLTAESDYKIFMRPGVPEVTRNAALQKLWRSDPVFANLDGLVEYGEDYAAAFKISAAVRTAYRVAQGMMGSPSPSNTTDQPPQLIDKRPSAETSAVVEPSTDRSARDGGDMRKDRTRG